MNYLKIYCNLIRKAENRTPPEGYTEKHHIFPKSIFGKNNRVVVLTGREHYIAHALLEKAFIKRYGLQHWKTIKMNIAHVSMKANRDMLNSKKYFNSYLYEGARIRFSNNLSGKNNPFYGKSHSEETRKKMSENGKGKKMPPRTDEYKKMLSERMKNRIVSEETKQKISMSKKGKSSWNKGRTGYMQAWNKGISKPSALRKYDYKLTSPDNEIYITNNLTYFCKIFSKYELNIDGLSSVARGKSRHHRQWKSEYIEKYLDNDSNSIYNITSDNEKMALSLSVEESLKEAEASLRNALSYAARQEKPFVSREISSMICAIDTLIKTDQLFDKLEQRIKGEGGDKGMFGSFFGEKQ